MIGHRTTKKSENNFYQYTEIFSEIVSRENVKQQCVDYITIECFHVAIVEDE